MLNYLVLLLLLLPNIAFAAQKIILKEGVATPITIANHSLNHIVVENDRIAAIKSDFNGVFEYDLDEKLGHIYIKPILNEYLEPIHIFITTEKEKILSLLLNPSKIKAESIRLVVEGTKGAARTWEKSNSYEGTITELIKSMHNNSSLEGFSVIVVKNSNKKAKKDMTKNLITVYQGEKLTGEVWLVENNAGKYINLSEKEFFKPGVRAVAILHKDLPHTTSTKVYRVIHNG